MPKGGKGGGGKPGGGGDGPLSLNGNKKNNILTGGDFDDNIWGRDGNDTLYGRGGGDFMHGGNGNDILIGDFGTLADPNATDPDKPDGDDRLFGGNGDDELYGGGGDDELQGGLGYDILDGGTGYDLALYSADDEAIYVTPTGDGFNVQFVGQQDEIAMNIEGIVGTYYDDYLEGALDRENTFNGYYGDDTIIGGDQGDWLDGHGDNDTIDGGAGADVIAGGSGNDDLTGGTGGDTFVYYSAYDGVDVINDFNGTEGDRIDLSALGLTAAAAAGTGAGDPITDGFVFLSGGQLFVDLNGGGPGEVDGDLNPINDDILLVDIGGGTIDLGTDIILDVLV